MRRNRVIYVLAVIGCLIFSAVYRSRLSAVLLAAVIGYPVLALLITAAELLFIKAEFTEERAIYEKNVPFDLWIKLNNRFIFAYAPAELLCVFPDRDTGIFSVRHIYASVAPLGKCMISVNCLHKYRGSYTAEIQKLSVYDPLRIIRLTKKAKAEMQQIFLPRKIGLGDLTVVSENDRSSAPTRLLAGDKEDFSHVREYRLGDMIQLVHWKLTAKQDELMIKQFDEITDKRAAVLCDYSFEGNETGLLLRADGIIETAIAFALSAVESGVKVRVDFGTLDRGFVSDIGDRTSFDRFYRLMAVLPARVDVAEFGSLIDNVDRNNTSVIFLVTGRLTEALICRADILAETFSGMVVLAFVNIGGSELETAAEGRGFVFLNIRGDDENGLSSAIESVFTGN
ncbi:MAG: DUF58 domain-containing protein [Oscillospiraceae bacterium]|nr:DUF58 domain-containing protein [Oscillospiraceae bacterium]